MVIINDTSGDDSLVGTFGDDTIYGGGGENAPCTP